MKYPTVLFDWGDTLMLDVPGKPGAMVDWDQVYAVEGAEDALKFLRSTGRRLYIATGAAVSDAKQIVGALARVGLDKYFEQRVFCQRNTGLPKGEEFYKYVAAELHVAPGDAVMIGDTLAKDVLPTAAAGIDAIWFNPKKLPGTTTSVTVHSMQELIHYFESLRDV
eukprot:m51a1_g3458 hypothetical protein (166) ;mRNA; r:690458-690955